METSTFSRDARALRKANLRAVAASGSGSPPDISPTPPHRRDGASPRERFPGRRVDWLACLVVVGDLAIVAGLITVAVRGLVS